MKEELEPPDEVLSSPYSILKARPKPAPVPAVAAKVGPIREQQFHCLQVDLEGRFEEAQPTPKASPVPSPPSNSPPEAVHHQPPLLGRPSQQGPKPSGTRKIKAEAFILNPLKGKADLPQIRRLESLPKVTIA